MAKAIATMDDLDAARAMFDTIAGAPHEIAVFAFLDRRHRVIALSQTVAGGVDQVAVPIRVVAREALVLDAAGLVMAHNHPSDDPTPSSADIAVTRRFDRALSALDLRLIDHLIVTRRGTASFRAMGLL